MLVAITHKLRKKCFKEHENPFQYNYELAINWAVWNIMKRNELQQVSTMI